MDATATPLAEPGQAEAGLARLIEAIPSYARWAGIRRDADSRPAAGELARAIGEGRVVVEVTLERAGRR